MKSLPNTITIAWMGLVFVALSLGRIEGSERRLVGREVFLQKCAKCHGPKGEGVKGKYDDPLRGDKALDKLTRYIERKMPDDHPGSCVGEEAAAVAHYIYDAFYSREAQARMHPARIELARLTNKQYLNTAADLLRHFTGGEPDRPKTATQTEHGLRAIYYNSKNFNDEKKAFERIDRQVDFDFGARSPDLEHGTNEFSIQWRGSLRAEETGDYEFLLKTPNGVRLWINDEDEPLIDAWVSSGQLAEHKAAVRLLGGRAYPLRLNLFKFKDKSASISLQWKPPHGTQQAIPARSLSPERARSTLVISTPFPPDDSSVGYERGVGVSKAWDEAATQAAIEIANYVLRKLDTLTQSKPGDTNRASKAQAFCADFAAQAFRRPLTEDQKRTCISSQFKKAAKLEDAVKRAVLLTLKSPRFLYLGLHEDQPDPFEVAERLSFGLWDSIPDDELWKAAAHDELHTPSQVRQQALRMLADVRSHVKMQLFFHHWLQMDRVEPLSKDDQLFPGFTPEIIADLRTSLNLFLEDAVWNGSSDYRNLLLADYLFVNERLAAFYGVSTNCVEKLNGLIELTELNGAKTNAEELVASMSAWKHGDPGDFVKVSFDAEHRSGVMTHPYLLSAFSYQKLTSPIHRGVFLTRNIVGRALRPPPMAMTFKDADFAPNLTMREKVSELTRPQACQTCHSVINPLGFSLESYDAVGRFRTKENDRPIDALSDYVADDGAVVHLAGPRDIAEFAIHNEQAQKSFIEQLFHHVVKQPVRAYGADVMDHLRRSFSESDFNVQKLLVEIASVSALHGVGKSEPAGSSSAKAEVSK